MSLGGGGTDLPAYSSKFGGFVVSAAVDKYVYVAANRRFSDDIRLSYSKTEIVPNVDAVEHRIFREALKLTGVDRGIELVSVADVPANSGLGSSSSFTVATLNALTTYTRHVQDAGSLAAMAYHVEHDLLGEPVGVQDGYVSAYGGVVAIEIDTSGAVEVEPVPCSRETLDELQANLVVFYSGKERSASAVLKEQSEKIDNGAAVESMHQIARLGRETYRLLCRGDVDAYGELLREHWERKRALTFSMTDAALDEDYALAREAGAVGGKLMGAGGGGFWCFYVQPAEKRAVCNVLGARGLRRMRFAFDFGGARIIANHGGGL